MGAAKVPPQFTNRSKHVYILGAGNLGKLVAHALRANHPGVRVSFIFKTQEQCKKFELASNAIEVSRNGEWNRQEWFECRVNNASGQHIRNLIVATKCHQTLEALTPIRFRLNGYSHICFMQNGMGIMEQVVEKLFAARSGKQRPKFVGGIVSHGVTRGSEFSAIHAGMGDITLGSLYHPRVIKQLMSEVVHPKSNERMLAACPELNVKFLSPREFYMAQLRKVAVNSVINPLTTLFQCKNGELLEDEGVVVLMKRLVQEISPILTATARDRMLEDGGAHKEQLSAASLQELVWDVATKTADNVSSMRQDRIAGRGTEIEHMNGYIVNQAEVKRLPCELNRQIVRLIKLGAELSKAEAPALLQDISKLLSDDELTFESQGIQRLWSPAQAPVITDNSAVARLAAQVRVALDIKAATKDERIQKKMVKKASKLQKGAMVKKLASEFHASEHETVGRLQQFTISRTEAPPRPSKGKDKSHFKFTGKRKAWNMKSTTRTAGFSRSKWG